MTRKFSASALSRVVALLALLVIAIVPAPSRAAAPLVVTIKTNETFARSLTVSIPSANFPLLGSFALSLKRSPTDSSPAHSFSTATGNLRITSSDSTAKKAMLALLMSQQDAAALSGNYQGDLTYTDGARVINVARFIFQVIAGVTTVTPSDPPAYDDLAAWSPITDIFGTSDPTVITVPGQPLEAVAVNDLWTSLYGFGGNSSGTSAPANGPGAAPLLGQWWLDRSTSPAILRIYDGSQWPALATLDMSGHRWILNGSALQQSGTRIASLETCSSSLVGAIRTVVDGDINLAAGMPVTNSGSGTTTYTVVCADYLWVVMGAGAPSATCKTPFAYMTSSQILDVLARTFTQDVSTPLYNFHQSIVTGGNYCYPPGGYKFTTSIALVIPYGPQQFSLTGSGSGLTQFVYYGGATNIDLFRAGSFTISDTNHNTLGVRIGGFTVRPQQSTYMTSGYTFHLGQFDQSTFFDISCGGGVLYYTNSRNCVKFAGAHQVTLENSVITALCDGVTIYGINLSSDADLTIKNSYLNQSGCAGLHSSGGFGGLFVKGTEILGNLRNNIRVDKIEQTAYSIGTREIILDATTVIDGAQYATTGDCIVLDDPDGNLATFESAAYIGSCGGKGINVVNWPNGIVSLTAGRLFNNNDDGAFTADMTTRIVAGKNLVVDFNSGFGFNASARTTNTHVADATYYANGDGSMSMNALTTNPYSMDLDQFKFPTDTSDCAAFQRSNDYYPGGNVYLPARKLYMGDISTPCQASITSAMHYIGVHPREGFTTGTIIEAANTSESPFYINGTGAQGFTIERVGVTNPQVASPASGWTPIVYNPFFQVSNVGGYTSFKDIQGGSVYALLNVLNSGRVNADGIRVQCLLYCVSIDDQLDIDDYGLIQVWPFWSVFLAGDQYVAAWTEQNTDIVKLGRVDTANFKRIFGLSVRSGLHVTTTAFGVATRISVDHLNADSSKYAVYYDASAQSSEVYVGTVDGQHKSRSTGGSASIPGSQTIYSENGARGNVFRYGTMNSDYAAESVIDSADDYNQFFGSTDFWNHWGSSGSGAPAMNAHANEHVIILPGQIVANALTSGNFTLPTTGSTICYWRAGSQANTQTCAAP